MAPTLSPPPTIEYAELFATALATCKVPFLKRLSSYFPSGPFHTICPAFLISSVNILAVFLPISSPTISASKKFVFTTFSPLSATWSTGRSTFILAFLASLKIFFASSTRSKSTIDLPIFIPSASKNVYAIPPPIRTVSALPMMFLISKSLSLTLAPPNMATNGFFGF